MKFAITLTWSKLMALILTVASVYVDKISEVNGSVFMFTVPFIVALILGKQAGDAVKEIKKNVS